MQSSSFVFDARHDTKDDTTPWLQETGWFQHFHGKVLSHLGKATQKPDTPRFEPKPAKIWGGSEPFSEDQKRRNDVLKLDLDLSYSTRPVIEHRKRSTIRRAHSAKSCGVKGLDSGRVERFADWSFRPRRETCIIRDLLTSFRAPTLLPRPGVPFLSATARRWL